MPALRNRLGYRRDVAGSHGGRQATRISGAGCRGRHMGGPQQDGLWLCHRARPWARHPPGPDSGRRPTAGGARQYARSTSAGPDRAAASSSGCTICRWSLAASCSGSWPRPTTRSLSADAAAVRAGDRQLQALQHRAVDNILIKHAARCFPVANAAALSSLATALGYASGAPQITKSVIQLHGRSASPKGLTRDFISKEAMYLSAQLGNEAVQRRTFEPAPWR